MKILSPVPSNTWETRMEDPTPTFFTRRLTEAEERFINGRSPNLFSWLTSLKRQLAGGVSRIENAPEWAPFDQFILLLAHCLAPEHDIHFQELTRSAAASKTLYHALYSQLEQLKLHRSDILIKRIDLIRQARGQPNPVREQARALWGDGNPSFDEQLLELETLTEDRRILLKILYAIVLTIAGTDFHRRHLLVDGLTSYPPTKQRRRFLS